MNSLLVRLLLVLSIALVPALGFRAYTESEARRVRQQQAEVEALRLVRLVSSEQQRIVEGAAQVLDTLSGAPAVQDNMPALCQRLLVNLLQQLPRYNHAAVIGLDGHLICAPEPIDPGIDFSDRAYFRLALRTGGFAIGEYAVGRASGQPTIHMAKPFRNRDGAVVGVVELALSLDWLGQQLGHLALPPQAAASITDRNGTILARYPDGARYIGRSIPAADRFSLDGDEIRVASMKSLEGRDRIAAYSPPGASPKGLRIWVGLDRELTFAAVTHESLTGLMLIVAGAGLALAITVLLGTRLIRRPFSRLLSAADRWRTGDLAARTGLRGDSSEFGRLAAAFDAMAAAQEAREHALRTALESTTDSVMVLDRAWRFTYLNERAKAQLAQGRDLMGQVIWEAFPELAGHPLGEAARAAMEGDVPMHAEGYYAPLDIHFDGHGYPSDQGLTVFFRDVAEERRTAVALRESEERFHAMFEQAAVGMALVGLDGSWLRVNDKVCAITGYARDELLASRFQDITHPDDLETDLAQMKALLAGEIAIQTTEKRYLRKGGGAGWVNLTASLLRDREGRPERIIVVIQDITERRHVEAALRESETRLQLVREAAAFGVWDWDLATGVATWSEDQWRLHGYRAPRPAGADLATWRASVHPEDRDRVQAELMAALSEPGRSYDTEYRVVDPDGTVRWLLAKAKVVRDTEGRAVRVVGLNMDVTASRETEAALRRLSSDLEARVRAEVGAREAAQARAALAERLQALGQLAGGIAHDFNNVLQAVSSAVSLIESRSGDEAVVRRLARLASEAAERGASITHRLLAFGRRGDLRPEAVDTAHLLSGLREMLAHTLGAAIDVQVRLAAGLPPLLADKGQLETVLVNLATNARDAMPEGGRLILCADTEIVSSDGPPHPARLAPGNYVRLAVIDAGVGMDAVTLARACEPFFTTKSFGVGTGLGLAMTRGFAEQSGGALNIESSPTNGTTVTLWLPALGAERSPVAASTQVAADTAAFGPGTATAGARVLLVDDEDLVRVALAEHLKDAGCAILAASSGAEALAMLAAGEAVDALVTDLSMPGMDGIALIHAAQARRPGLPAVLLTGYASDEEALAVSGAVSGSYSLLRKPVRGRQLVDRLHALLAGRMDATR